MVLFESGGVFVIKHFAGWMSEGYAVVMEGRRAGEFFPSYVPLPKSRKF